MTFMVLWQVIFPTIAPPAVVVQRMAPLTTVIQVHKNICISKNFYK